MMIYRGMAEKRVEEWKRRNLKKELSMRTYKEIAEEAVNLGMCLSDPERRSSQMSKKSASERFLRLRKELSEIIVIELFKQEAEETVEPSKGETRDETDANREV